MPCRLRDQLASMRPFAHLLPWLALQATLVVVQPLCAGRPLTPAELGELQRAILKQDLAVHQVPADPAVVEADRLAADAGDPAARVRYGYWLQTGNGVRQDFFAARAQYQAAANAGLPSGQMRLALCDLEGWGGPVNRPAFAQQMKLAAVAGYQPAQEILGMMYASGIGVPRDPALALDWFERAAAQDSAFGQLSVGAQLESKARYAPNSDLALARSWYQLAAQQEYADAYVRMARTLWSAEPAQRNWPLAERWLQMAIEAGNGDAAYTLGVCLLRHVDVPVHDPDRARELFKWAALHGSREGLEILQLETGGRTLADAAVYLIRMPVNERYIAAQELKGAAEPDRPPRVVEIKRPIYPPALVLAGTKGSVVVKFVVDTSGRTKNLAVASSTDPAFNDNALAAVRLWRFEPGLKNGQPAEFAMAVPVMFELRGSTMGDLDTNLRAVAALARQMGGQAAADAEDLTLGQFAADFPRVTMADGSEPPKGARGALIVALDETGTPLRVHIVDGRPQDVAELMRASVLKRRFFPRIVAGRAVPSNVVVLYRFGKFDDDVLDLMHGRERPN